MKLLFVIPEYLPTSGGGIVTFYRHLLPALVRAGAQVTALVGSAVSQPGGDRELEGVRVIGLEPAQFAARLPRFPQLAATPTLHRHVAAAWALYDQARALGPFDVVETADWGIPGVPWILAGEAPVLVRCHGSAGQIAIHERDAGMLPLDQLLLSIERSLFARAAGMASYGAANAEQWSGWIGRECAHREPALPLPPQAAVGDADWCLVLARVQRWKGPQVLGAALEAMATPPPIRWVGRDVADADAGGSSTLASMRRQFPRGWGRVIERRETVDSALAAQWTKAARGVLVPSTWDVFNFAGAEAMAAGAVVLASDGAGMSRWIAHGDCGLRFVAGNSAALASELTRMVGMSSSERRRLGEAARQVVALRADPDRVAARELAAFRSLPAAQPVADPLDDLLRPMAGPTSIDSLLAQFGLRGILRHSLHRIGRRMGLR